MEDNKLRTLLKTVSWRVVGTLDTMIVSWFVTGSVLLALSIGSIELVTKMIIYYYHERLWNKISFGRNQIIKHSL